MSGANGFVRKIVRGALDQVDQGYRGLFLSLLDFRPGCRLLDCGSGDGSFTARIAEACGAGEICAIEISPENMRKAAERGIRVFEGDLNETFPFDDESFDVITANQVIEHLSNTDSFLREVRRVIRKGGVMVIATPNLASLHNIGYLLLGLQPYWCNVSDEVLAGTWHPTSETKLAKMNSSTPGHRRLFTPKALRDLFGHHGFAVQRISVSGFYPLPNALGATAARVFPNHGAIILARVSKT